MTSPRVLFRSGISQSDWLHEKYAEGLIGFLKHFDMGPLNGKLSDDEWLSENTQLAKQIDTEGTTQQLIDFMRLLSRAVMGEHVIGPLTMKQGNRIVVPYNPQGQLNVEEHANEFFDVTVYDDHGQRLSDQWIVRPFDFSDGIKWYGFRVWFFCCDPNPELDADAQETFSRLNEFERIHAFQCQDALEVAESCWSIANSLRSGDGTGLDVAKYLLSIGRSYEHFKERVLDEFIRSELDRREGASRGAKRTNEKRAAARPDYAAAVRDWMDKGLNYTSACEQVASEHGVVARTVDRYSRELAPKRTNGKRLSR